MLKRAEAISSINPLQIVLLIVGEGPKTLPLIVILA